ncbi:hypothetical protein CLOM_g9161 [Closterium sp. NIES-68]|nr:hypothetical protein CLOM_g9161 [Closterium sp. NIES-68]
MGFPWLGTLLGPSLSSLSFYPNLSLAPLISCSSWREGGQVPWPNSNCWTAILRGGTKASKGCGWSRTREALSHRLL